MRRESVQLDLMVKNEYQAGKAYPAFWSWYVKLFGFWSPTSKQQNVDQLTNSGFDDSMGVKNRLEKGLFSDQV